MKNANLLKVLSGLKKSQSIERVTLYGRVRCAIKKPELLSGLSNVDYGSFAILDCFGIKCNGEDYFYPTDPSYGHLYNIKGSCIIYISSMDWVGKTVKISNTKIRQQFGKKTATEGITSLAFKWDSASGTWVVLPNKIAEINADDRDLKNTTFEDIVFLLENSDTIPYDASLDSMLAFEGVSEYEEIKETKEVKSECVFDPNSEKLDVTKIDLNLVHHLEGQELSKNYEIFEEQISCMSVQRKRYTGSLVKDISAGFQKGKEESENIAKKIRSSFIENIAKNQYNVIGNSNIKGKVVVQDFLDLLQNYHFDSQKNGDDLKLNSQQVMEVLSQVPSLVEADASILYQHNILGINLPMLESDCMFALGVISVSTGISLDSFKANFGVSTKLSNISFQMWFYTLLYKPYILGMLGSSLGIVDLDKIYLSYTKSFTDGEYSRENGKIRNDLLYLETLKGAHDKNTIVPLTVLKTKSNGYPATGSRNLQNNSFPANRVSVEVLSVICGNDLKLNKRSIDLLIHPKWFTEERTNDLDEKGIILVMDDEVILSKDFEKEFMIYDVLHEKGLEETGITEEQITSTIEKFENSRGFQLESLQKDGVKLCMCKAGVLSGCAGSGKTTTSDCFTECIKEYLPDYKLVFCTPTGKACRRLAEVVGGVVRTLHSEFGIGLYGESYLTDVTKRKRSLKNNEENKPICYILDEMAMSSMSLLYEVARNLQDDDIVYFLGDIKQLPPIGKGNPFALLMKLLPCVELGVSKRAAEGSEINYNTTLVNCVSDDYVKELYFDDSTFICKECDDAEIPLTVAKVFSGLMNGSLTGKSYKEEDIQVISGYATDKYIFSSTTLNKTLQGLLRKNDKLLFNYGENPFYMNERVIHTKVNSYGKQRYIQLDENTYKAVLPTGVVNGEMGTLVGIVCSSYVEILNFEENDLDEIPIYEKLDDDAIELLLEARKSREDTLQDDSNIDDPKTYFVKVKVYDVDLGMDVFIFYRAREMVRDDVRQFSGSELGNLELAYALTTHKMQGSQSPVVILPFGTTCNPSFINRNMINTMITRSQEVVVMVGTILGSDSPVTQGRKCPSQIKTKDALSILVEEEGCIYG